MALPPCDDGEAMLFSLFDFDTEDDMHLFYKSFVKRAALLLAAAAMGALLLVGCKRGGDIEAPEGLTREEAALFTAVASVCPRNDNNTKAEYLTFRIAGWSFEEIPEPVLAYLREYCAAGHAAMMQFDDEGLIKLGLLGESDPETGSGFFDDDELVYASGKGKIFTFTLKSGEDTSKDECRVSVESYISFKDSSGYDIVLEYDNGAWRRKEYTNAWSRYQLFTPVPTSDGDTQK